MARLRYEIIFAPEAIEDLRRLSARDRAAVLEAVDRHLRHEPTRVSGSRIKRLRGLARPQCRLRVEDIRVFYDVGKDRVELLAIVRKADAQGWLREKGEPR